MYISKISVKNFRSIDFVENLELNKFNIFVGQNNHGKTNFFEAIEWFYSGKMGDVTEIKRKGSGNEEMFVELEFVDVQKGIERMSEKGSNKTKIQNVIQDATTARIRFICFKDGDNWTSKKQVLDENEEDESKKWKNPSGIGNALNEFLPSYQFVKTEVQLKDKVKYGKKTEIGEMLSGVINEILQSEDEEYKSFVEKFNELFIGQNSKVSQKLSEIGSKVEKNLQKQFPECSEVKFAVKEPVFDDLLKNFQTKVDDGHVTTAEEKGDGMQRALMLAIIQTYAEYRKENEKIKNFVFLVDEAELHLHPTAQRKLKEALMILAKADDQVLISSHSSVLISDEFENQKMFRVEKSEHKTSISNIQGKDKFNVVYELLGGSPSDLLLPHNFILVEGTSDKNFIDLIISRFYPDKNIQIIPVWGDIEKTDRVLDDLASAYAPFGQSLYSDKLIILLDKVSDQKQNSLNEFYKKYPNMKKNKNNQVFELPFGSIEEYYPFAKDGQAGGHRQAEKWNRTTDEVKNMSPKQKHSLAKHVGIGIEQEQFENNMQVIFNAIKKCSEKAF